jgi:hypothetical protein
VKRSGNGDGLLLAVGTSSALFALAHTERGVIGVGLTFLDAVFFSVRIELSTGGGGRCE